MAHTITPDQLSRYKRTARLREQRRQREDEQRRAAAWIVARQAAQVLKCEFAATRVVVYGSLAHGHWFHPRSDIDLAVEGILAADFWRAWAALDRIDPAFEINLIDLVSASDSFREVIERQGVDL